MKTKHILRLSALALAGTALTACSFLDMDPHVIPDEGYYTSEQKIIYGLAGVYGVLGSEALYGDVYSLQISNADDLCYFNNTTNSEARPDKYNHSAGTESVYETWAKLYEGIKNANRFLAAMEHPAVDETKLSVPLARYRAEARFLRAYYHFLLAQAWGDVPLHTEPTTSPNPEDVKLAATPQAEVLRWCADEIEALLADLDEGVDGTPSRVNRTVAQGILARIYLFTAGATIPEGDTLSKKELYGRAAHWAGQVIASGRHDLNPDYEQVFIHMIQDKYDTQYRESMWEAEFQGDRTSASAWSNGRIGDLIGLKSQSPANNYSEWACNYSYGFYNGSYRLWQYYWATDRTEDETADPHRITDRRQEWNLPPYNYRGENGKKLTYKVNGESRTGYFTQKASMHPTPWIYNNSFSLPADRIEGQDVSIEEAFNLRDLVYDPTVMAAVRNAGKWRRETIYEKQMTAKRLYTTINFPILRYADVLLMYAEAVNEYRGAPDELARECVRRVRSRAGIATDEHQLNGYAEFRTLVRNERARELAFEGLRKWDLIRWGVFVEAMHAAGAELQTENKYKNGGIVDFAAGNYANVSAKHVYLPIPAKELAVNHALRQHPLW